MGKLEELEQERLSIQNDYKMAKKELNDRHHLLMTQINQLRKFEEKIVSKYVQKMRRIEFQILKQKIHVSIDSTSSDSNVTSTDVSSNIKTENNCTVITRDITNNDSITNGNNNDSNNDNESNNDNNRVFDSEIRDNNSNSTTTSDNINHIISNINAIDNANFLDDECLGSINSVMFNNPNTKKSEHKTQIKPPLKLFDNKNSNNDNNIYNNDVNGSDSDDDLEILNPQRNVKRKYTAKDSNSINNNISKEFPAKKRQKKWMPHDFTNSW